MKKAQIFYADIGDYLTREQKLKIIRNTKSIENLEYAELQNSLSKQISDQNKEINDASDELAKKNNAADKEYQDAYDTLHEGTYGINNTAL